MKKFVAGLIAGAAVLALTLITVLLEPTIFLTPRWKAISISIGVIAILAMVVQAIWTKQDEDAERREREKLYKQVRKVLKEAAKRQAARHQKAPPTLADEVRERAIYQAQAIVEFLSSTEPERQKTTYHLQETLGGGIELSKDASWKELRSLAIDQLRPRRCPQQEGSNSQGCRATHWEARAFRPIESWKLLNPLDC